MGKLGEKTADGRPKPDERTVADLVRRGWFVSEEEAVALLTRVRACHSRYAFETAEPAADWLEATLGPEPVKDGLCPAARVVKRDPSLLYKDAATLQRKWDALTLSTERGGVGIAFSTEQAREAICKQPQAGRTRLREYEIGLTRAAGGVLDGYTAALRGSGYDTAAVGTDAFARSLATTRSNVAALRNAQTVKPAQLLEYLDTSLALYQPALSLNYSAAHVCPAAPAAPPCTLPPAPGAIALTPLQYGVTTAPLDARKQGADTCTRTPCNQ